VSSARPPTFGEYITVAEELTLGGEETTPVFWEGAAVQEILDGEEVETVFCEVAAEEKIRGSYVGTAVL
jgi:hypothetical protein